MDERRRTPQEMMNEEPVQGFNDLEDTMMEESNCVPEQNLRAEYMPPIMAAGQVRKTEDPWDHNKLRCGSCMWFKPKTRGHVLGRCRRRAPTLSGFPVVSSISDWCGDHKIVE